MTAIQNVRVEKTSSTHCPNCGQYTLQNELAFYHRCNNCSYFHRSERKVDYLRLVSPKTKVEVSPVSDQSQEDRKPTINGSFSIREGIYLSIILAIISGILFAVADFSFLQSFINSFFIIAFFTTINSSSHTMVKTPVAILLFFFSLVFLAGTMQPRYPAEETVGQSSWGQVMVTTKRSNYRAGRSTKFEVRGTFKKNKKVRAAYYKKGWYAVFPLESKGRQSESEALGYIYGKLLKRTGSTSQ